MRDTLTFSNVSTDAPAHANPKRSSSAGRSVRAVQS